MLQQLRTHAQRHRLWDAGTRIVAAVSGGSDSVGMLRLLHELHRLGELRLAAVAHLNHAIRASAGEDETFCGELAARLGLPFVSATVDVPALARSRRQSLELAGRLARRRFLQGVRRERGADAIATAHTRDDQAETVVLRMLRGAGTRGLAAIRPRRDPYIRPVLFATRDQLRDELASRHQDWREDESNADLAIRRNRVRHELLPYLERHFNPSARAALARLADALQTDEAHLAREAAAAAVRVLASGGGACHLDVESLHDLPPALQRRVVALALTSAWPAATPALQHVDAVLEVASGARTAAEVPGIRVELSGGSVVLLRKGQAAPDPPPFEAILAIPGAVEWPAAGVQVTADGPLSVSRAREAVGRFGEDAQVVVASADEVGPFLIVRSRRPGDRLRPFGLGGRKKVQDLLVDRKVERDERDRVPIVTDTRGRIVWVAGQAFGEEFRVSDDTKAVIILKFSRI